MPKICYNGSIIGVFARKGCFGCVETHSHRGRQAYHLDKKRPDQHPLSLSSRGQCMSSDIEQLILKRLDSFEIMLRDIQNQQHENALKIRTIETRLASYAGIAGLLAAGAIQIVEHIFF